MQPPVPPPAFAMLSVEEVIELVAAERVTDAVPAPVLVALLT